MENYNRLVLIGNGFDLAYGLKTCYKDFLDWYFCTAFQQFIKDRIYEDALISMKNIYSGIIVNEAIPKTLEEVLNLMSPTQYRSFKLSLKFFSSVSD